MGMYYYSNILFPVTMVILSLSKTESEGALSGGQKKPRTGETVDSFYDSACVHPYCQKNKMPGELERSLPAAHISRLLWYRYINIHLDTDRTDTFADMKL